MKIYLLDCILMQTVGLDTIRGVLVGAVDALEHFENVRLRIFFLICSDTDLFSINGLSVNNFKQHRRILVANTQEWRLVDPEQRSKRQEFVLDDHRLCILSVCLVEYAQFGRAIRPDQLVTGRRKCNRMNPTGCCKFRQKDSEWQLWAPDICTWLFVDLKNRRVKHEQTGRRKPLWCKQRKRILGSRTFLRQSLRCLDASQYTKRWTEFLSWFVLLPTSLKNGGNRICIVLLRNYEFLWFTRVFINSMRFTQQLTILFLVICDSNVLGLQGVLIK